ncbi:uncharacterized protein LOC124833557 [Vigna umbellata]|uniref:uncharacterized protein LOC124833557 n=1 Tax=Vigna umbellata TaxID=87088 RepID=UPI001F5F3E8F|nr:uncharacterized protein LOC124833557 [Vigna umbellata]
MHKNFEENRDIEQKSDSNEDTTIDTGIDHTNDREDHNSRKSTRVKRVPGYLNDYIHQVNHSSSSYLHGKNSYKTPYPISNVLSYNSLSEKHLKYTLAISVNNESKSYNEAKDKCEWITAMKRELKALQDNDTWCLTQLPLGKNFIGCKWVYKIKHKADGIIERYKACLVAKGYIQQEGIDFLDNFSPVAKLTNVRILLAIAASRNWHLHQLDVDNAFLHGDLNEEKTSTNFTALLVYVDDIILAGDSITEIEHIKCLLHHSFRIKNLGKLIYFLGFEVARSKRGIRLCQRKYALDILEETGMLGCKPYTTSFLSDTNSLYKTENYLANPSSYRRLIRKFLYLTNTRPDLCFSVNLLSQFVQAPTDYHYRALHHMLRYVKFSLSQGLFFAADSHIQIKAFSDSDWATCPNTRRSTTGFSIFLGSSLISWKTKKHNIVSMSSIEA